MELTDWNKIRWFRRNEFVCHHCGAEEMQLSFMYKLDALREKFGKPLIISSGYRCPFYNASVSETGDNGPHTTGLAADVRIYGADAFFMVRLAMQQDFTGLGLQQKGDVSRRFVHVDAVIDVTRPRIWTY